MTRPRIYLAGPIAEHPDPQAWRFSMKNIFFERALCISPCNPADLEQQYDPHMQSILSRCHMHVTRADVLVVNFLGATCPSLGTMAEIAWAWQHKKPIVVICDDGNPNDYCMTRSAATFWVDTVEEGCAVVDLILRDYYPVDNRYYWESEDEDWESKHGRT